MKKLKNYIVIALIIIVGLATLWDELSNSNESNDGEQLVLVEQSSDQEVQTDEGSGSGQSSNADGEKTESETVSETEKDTEAETTESIEVTINKDEEHYQQALDSIRGYNDITDVVWLSEVDSHVQKAYENYDEDGWKSLVDNQSAGTKAGGSWRNYDDQLPKVNLSGDDVSYKEFDVNNKISGQSRDAERFVVGSDSFVYYTSDHYDSFVRIIE